MNAAFKTNKGEPNIGPPLVFNRDDNWILPRMEGIFGT